MSAASLENQRVSDLWSSIVVSDRIYGPIHSSSYICSAVVHVQSYTCSRTRAVAVAVKSTQSKASDPQTKNRSVDDGVAGRTETYRWTLDVRLLGTPLVSILVTEQLRCFRWRRLRIRAILRRGTASPATLDDFAEEVELYVLETKLDARGTCSSSRTWHATEKTGYRSGHGSAESLGRWPDDRNEVPRNPQRDLKLRFGNTSCDTSSDVTSLGTSRCRGTFCERPCCENGPSRP